MAAYGKLAAAAFRQHSTYRMATLAGVFTNTVFGFIRASILLAALAISGAPIGGYTPEQAMTYVWLTQALLAPIEAFGTTIIAERVKSGDIASDLLRPVGLLRRYYAEKIGRAGFYLLARGIPPMVVGALVTGMAAPTSPWSYLLGAVSIWLAITVSFLCDLLINLTTFWLIDSRGLTTLYLVSMNFLGGFLIPITWFPATLESIARATPFPSIVQIPIDVVSGRIEPTQALPQLGIQAAWALALTVTAVVVCRRGVRTLEVQGG